MAKSATLLWVDLEMTGLDPQNDVILEVAAIATNWAFTELGVYEGIVRQDEQVIADRMAVSREFWDANPAVRSALLEQNKRGKVLELIEDALLKFIDEHFEPETRVLLAGNSIHMDRQFIKSWWPRLDERLHYRMLDVSAWKVVFEGKYGKKFAKPEQHRALLDIRGSIMELKYYLGKIKV